ncbi:hypothetical protein Tco_0434762 [Tanacetum coccineum]
MLVTSGSASFMILPSYTSALEIAYVFGCLMCSVAWLHVALQIVDVFGFCSALVCMHLFGYTSALQIADVFGSGSGLSASA